MRLIFLTIFYFFVLNALSQRDTTFFNEEGNSTFTGKIIDDKKIGIWYQLKLNGDTINTIKFLDSLTNNCIISSSKKNGSIAFYNGNFQKNKLVYDGDFKLLDNKNLILQSGKFKNGKKNGIWENYQLNTIKKIECFLSENDIYYISFSNKGILTSITQYDTLFYSNGIEILFDDSTKFKSIGKYENGCKIGEWLYFENGKLKSKGSYLNDYLHYSIINDKAVIVNKNDILAETIYSSNIISTFLLSNDVLYIKHGLWMNFDENGITTDEMYYFKGEKISKYKYKRLSKIN